MFPLDDVIMGRDFLPEADPGTKPRSLERQRYRYATRPFIFHNTVWDDKLTDINSLTPEKHGHFWNGIFEWK